MSRWDGAFRNIRRRTVGKVLESVAVEVPFAFDVEAARSDIPDFLDANWETISAAQVSVISLPGRDMNFVRDTLIAATKFFHVIDCARSQVQRGAMTWGMVDAYHASLIGARLLSALYGVLSYSVRGRTVLVDFRPELGSVDEAKAFRKEARDVAEPVRLICPQPKFLEQSDVWALVIRLCDIGKLDAEGEDVEALLALRENVCQPVSAFRNTMLYDSVSWEWTEELTNRQVPAQLLLSRLKDEKGGHSLTLALLSKLFALAKRHVSQLGQEVGFDPTVLSPTFSCDPTPEQLFSQPKCRE